MRLRPAGQAGSYEYAINSGGLAMRTVPMSLVLLLLGVASFVPPAFAAYPGSNGHVAYTKVIDAGTGTERRAIFIDGAQASFPAARPGGTSEWDSYPAFSPDGSQLAFVRQDGSTLDYLFYVAKANGTNPRRVASLSDFDLEQWGSAHRSKPLELVWSPDGKSVGFVRTYVTFPFLADAINTVNVADGHFETLATNPFGGQTSFGFDWLTVGQGSIITRCVTALPNTLFCVLDERGNLLGVTAYAPATATPAGLGLSLIAVPRWQPDDRGGKPRAMFPLMVPATAGAGSLAVSSIFSIRPSDGTDPNGIGADLIEHTPGRETVSCTSVIRNASHTAYAARYVYGDPHPSPDGNYFLARRTENDFKSTRSGNDIACALNTVTDDLVVFRYDGAVQRLVDSKIDTSFGIAWQPSPANLVITVTDGHGDELRGVPVEVRDATNPDLILYGNPLNSSGGQYLFESVPPGKYRVRVTLDDKESMAFEVQHDRPASGAVWVERAIVVPPDQHKVAIDFQFTDIDIANSSVDDPVQRHDLDDMAAIFFQTRRFVDWVHANLTASTGAKVTIFAFDSAIDTMLYQPGQNSIVIGVDDSDFSNRNGSGMAPVNGEWHEFAHHLEDAFIDPGLSCPGLNHLGYPNPSSCDSLSEGFAAFLAAWANGSPDYVHMFNLEDQTQAWDSRVLRTHELVSAEDDAVAALLWDLVDDTVDSDPALVTSAGGSPAIAEYTDNVNLSLRDLWKVLTSAHPTTVVGLRKALDADPRYSVLSIDLDGDGTPDVTPVDELFLMHGFFPTAINLPTGLAFGPRYDYSVADAQLAGEPTRNEYVGRTDHLAVSFGGIPYPAVNPRSNLQPAAGANLSIQAHDAAGRELQGVEVTLTLHYPGFDRPLTQVLPTGTGSLVHLELPMYFSYLLEPGQTDLPPCDPAHDRYVSVTLTASINGFAATNSHGFDNCDYVHAVFAATGPAAASYAMTFPEDAAPPVTQIDTNASGNVVGQYTDGSWTVTLFCQDPVVGNFASGCLMTQYSIDGGPFVRAINPVTISAPGLHTFSYLSRDAAGNDEALMTVSLGIASQLNDQTAPVTTASALASVPPVRDNATTGFWTVSLSCSDPPDPAGVPVSGCLSTEFSLDNSGFMPYSEPVVIEGVGQHTLHYRSTDAAGNYERAQSISLEIIATADVPTVVGLSQAAAASAITTAGLVVGTITQQSSSTVPSGTVISQSPSAGASVVAGSVVNLVVSTGVPSGSIFDNLRTMTQATKISVPALKQALLANVSTAEWLYTHERPAAALAAIELYQQLVRAASGHAITKPDATTLLMLSDAIELEIRTKLAQH